jgi:hypothetical protein
MMKLKSGDSVSNNRSLTAGRFGVEVLTHECPEPKRLLPAMNLGKRRRDLLRLDPNSRKGTKIFSV